jgi:hypothetical protein
MEDLVSWIATIATITAALMTASNLGPRITGYGFAVFTVGSLSWLSLGLMTDQQALVWTNIVLTCLNLFGIWRWLGRQTRIEEGASAAAVASEHTPGETLFPVSLLMKAPIEDRTGHVLGNCVDAMAGCTSGRLRYVVASEGGLAGVGETLRRLPWSDARMDSDRLVIGLNRSRFSMLERMQTDAWPPA